MDQSIVIIGAGAAGLMAAYELASRDYRVTVLEARESTGGRIRAPLPGFTGVAEPGAEFVHGKLPLTFEWLQQARLSKLPVEGEMITVMNNQWQEQEEMTIGWDRLLEHMNKLKEDMTVAHFLSRDFGEPKYEALRDSVRGYAQGFDLADIDDASVFSLRDEWSHEEEGQYRVEGGYIGLIRFFEKKLRATHCQFRLGVIVKKIEWEKNDVVVTASDGARFTASKLLVTVPIGVLQASGREKAAIEWAPAIPGHSKAFYDIGYGTVTKVLLEFKKPFWESFQKNIGFVISRQAIPTWWTQNPSRYPLLTGWLGGPPALQPNRSREKLLELSFESLANIFRMESGVVRDGLQAAWVEPWQEDPFALGAYSYSLLKSKAAIEKLQMPVEETIYFAGEAIYEGHSPGTVEAALQSGKEVAGRILADLA